MNAGALYQIDDSPLTLLHHSIGLVDCPVVSVRSRAERFGIALEEALRRLEQFSVYHQAILMAGVADYFGFNPLGRLAADEGWDG